MAKYGSLYRVGFVILVVGGKAGSVSDETILLPLFFVVDAAMILSAVVIDFTISHAIRGMTVKGNTDRFRGTFPDSAISNGAESIGYRLIADRAGRAVAIILTCVADLGRAAGRKQQYQRQCSQKRSDGGIKSEEFRGDLLLLHGGASPMKKNAISDGVPKMGTPESAVSISGCTVGPGP